MNYRLTPILRLLSLVLVLFGGMSALPAAIQQHVVVPSSSAAVDGNLVRRIYDDVPTRVQVLIDASHLTGLLGRTITAVQWRRDAGFQDALGAGTAAAVARIGVSGRLAGDASTNLSENLPTPVEVFRGDLRFPASPRVPATGRVEWIPENRLEIRFSTPYLYQGGGLCVELEQAGVSIWWPTDAVSFGAEGNVQLFGLGCSPYASVDGWSMEIGDSDLVVGATARFFAYGEAGANAFLVIGARPLPVSWDLAAIGAAGCALHVDPVSVLTTAFSSTELAPAFGAVAARFVHLPSDVGLLGSTFYAQWLEWGRAVRTSNAVQCAIDSVLPQHGMAMVTDNGLTTVDVGLAPVIRFEVR